MILYTTKFSYLVTTSIKTHSSTCLSYTTAISLSISIPSTSLIDLYFISNFLSFQRWRGWRGRGWWCQGTGWEQRRYTPLERWHTCVSLPTSSGCQTPGRKQTRVPRGMSTPVLHICSGWLSTADQSKTGRSEAQTGAHPSWWNPALSEMQKWSNPGQQPQ